MNLSKVKLSLVLRDALATGVAIEGILAIVSAVFSKVNLGAGAIAITAAISGVVAAVVSFIARAVAAPTPIPASLAVAPGIEVDPTTTAGLASILQAILSHLSPGTSSASISAFIAELTGLASFVFGIINPGSTFSTTDQTFVTIGGLGFLVVMAGIHTIMGSKVKMSANASAANMLSSHLFFVSSIASQPVPPPPGPAVTYIPSIADIVTPVDPAEEAAHAREAARLAHPETLVQ